MEFLSNVGSAADQYRPSVFELVAQDKMRDLLKPALRYVLAVYAQRHPRYLLRLANKSDELFASLMGLVEWHYLREWDGSFAENFYGLKRVAPAKNRRQKGEQRLTSAQIGKSLFFLAVMPYLKSKLDDLYEQMSGGSSRQLLGNLFAEPLSQSRTNDDEQLPRVQRIRQQIARTFCTTYPYVNATYQALIFLYQIGFMYGKTDYYSPWLHLCGVQLRRMGPKDYVSIITVFFPQRDHESRKEAANAAAQLALRGASSLTLARHSLLSLLSRGLDFLKTALPMSIFFFRFLEWWYSSEYSQKGTNQPIPPPPEPIAPHPDGVALPSDSTICPLCEKTRTNPTMLPSGYVFCYPCVYKYVETNGCCPITRVQTTCDELRKIYSV
ncbi:Pex12 amino terminal region-domain-containing protein [Phlyctochytrium arcticum]|nr:Pex12 amino terminal region-domain-containing protein [Phlyctochytrium arcticum]